ncbi:hypothetical protein F0562_014159 [Nyssa sinensis]|uniref:BHLH domain-containing protein n=1 Tax=Nyssa sinensis TaxID=561372 RepID=A0A5J4ZS92_9ASTE|nr:hypothetical protein F0562_014159 [Nyssa sinensis]
MADEFQAGVCGGTWWNSSRSSFGSSPCSTAINDIGSFGWPGDLLDMKAKSSDESAGSISDGSVVFQDIQKPHQQLDSVSGGSTILMDSSLQMMGIGLSSSKTTNWNQTLLGGTDSNYHHHPMLQEEMNSRLNYRQQTGIDCNEIQKDWCPDLSITDFKAMNQGLTSSGDSTATCQGSTTSFPMNSASYGCPSTLLQTLFDTDPQPQQSLFDNRSMTNNPSTTNYQANLNDLPSQFLASTFEEKPNCPNLTAKANSEEVRDSSLVRKINSSTEPAFKRPRIETPSPLPTFKVRKEKLGDRITALQQLVSPFGKTDTASVLHEAIEYIKFLHDQVNVLSTPYMKNGAPIQHQQVSDKLKDPEGPKQDLRSRGLCLVPISSTFPVANEPTADFWTPTFGGTFR